VEAELVLVKTPAEGLALVEDGKAAALAGDRIVLAVLARKARDPAKLQMLEEDYSYEPYALMLPRGDVDLRLAVNRELARLYRSGEIAQILNYWFGAIGGGLLGHKVEKNSRDKTYEVIVEMDDGSRRTVTYKSAPPVKEGERVRLRDGQLVVVQ
jgi:hypothetical protein